MLEDPEFTRLRQVLTKYSDPAMQHYRLILEPNPAEIKHFYSEMYFGTSVNKETGELMRVVYKLAPRNKLLDSFAELYRNEETFYTKIFPELKAFQNKKRVKTPFKKIPRFLGGQLGENEEYLVLENLTPGGYIRHDRKAFLNSEHLSMIFKTYAKFHALSFVYKAEHPEKFSNMTCQMRGNVISLENRKMAYYFRKAYEAAIDAFCLETEKSVIEKLKCVNDVVETMVRLADYQGEHSCLVHGDSSLSNMLFKYQENNILQDMKLIDFHLVFVTTPIHDLSIIFYSGAAKEDMDKLDMYLEIYYDSFAAFVRELGASPQEIYPFEVLKREWRTYGLIGVLMGIGMWVGKLLNKHEIFSFLERERIPRKQHFEVWNAKMVEIRQGEDFRRQARDICLHAVEYGII